jgi:AraC-like DNA-binding protein
METPPVTVSRNEDWPYGWERATRRPHPRLRGFVSEYEGYTQGTDQPMSMLEVPFAGVPLIISFGTSYDIVDSAGASERHQTFVAGMQDSWCVVESGRRSLGMQVNFTPIGARMFLGVSMESITNRTVELEDVFGHSVRSVVEQLQSTPNWSSRFDLLDRLIASSRLDAAPETPAPVLWAWNKLKSSSGNVSISGLAGDAGYSHKHLISRFRDQIGLPPKTVARVLRFDRAVQKMKRGEHIANWLDLADECGYFDQAHMIRDFREFAGMTPADFQARRLDFGGMDGTSN